MTLSLTLTIPQLLAFHGEAILSLLAKSQPPIEFIRAAYAAESAGQARFIITNHLRDILKTAAKASA